VLISFREEDFQRFDLPQRFDFEQLFLWVLESISLRVRDLRVWRFEKGDCPIVSIIGVRNHRELGKVWVFEGNVVGNRSETTIFRIVEVHGFGLTFKRYK
jgi:hypothetical protein